MAYYLSNNDSLQLDALLNQRKVREGFYELTKDIRAFEGVGEGLGYTRYEQEIVTMIPFAISKHKTFSNAIEEIKTKLSNYKIWTGSQAEYNSIAHRNDTLYFVTN